MFVVIAIDRLMNAQTGAKLVWAILALGSRDLRLNRTGFRVLRCVAGCRFSHFLCSASGISFKILIF